ncbi:50S ribosomal protein L7/L12 [Candidatus Walczuchella monophlebidarum]|uniref:Large ribosomal subunit protein bL12 n=1 Tax=Candidatus Walczuchella monophlebidarum TaxID=1415657 RepID=A0A068DSR8_9FLAO|nr:50S ribosomal protein L7/L12 [Candidatus Walczuchella monophlebidarum]AID37439.1 ribosomal protein L7/L12 [Candidatus Walczuchella monophlebidarum]
MSDIKKLAETLINLKVSEVNDLAKILKEEYGIEPAPIPVIDSGKPSVEKTSFDVVLKSAGSSKLTVVKLIKEITGLGLKDSKELVDSAPKNVKEGITKNEAESLKKKLEEAGASVELK